MLPLHVKSFFTNVPMEGTFDCFGNLLLVFHYSAIEIKETLNLVLFGFRQKVSSVFNGVFCFQFENQCMGNPLLLFCDIYKHYFEKKFFSANKFLHWFRYVDDNLFLFLPILTFKIVNILLVRFFVVFSLVCKR